MSTQKVGHPLLWGPTDDDYAGAVPFRDADAYDKGRPPYPEEVIKWVVARCEAFGADLKLVDIGCGNGRAICALSKALAQNPKVLRKTVYGVDCDSGMLEKAKKTGLDIQWILSKVKELPSAITDKVQVVTACSALHYCNSSEDIEAISKVLTADGIVVEVNGGGPLNCRTMQQLMGEPVEGSERRHGEKKGGVRERMEWGGFQVADQTEFHIMVRHTAETALEDIKSSLSIQTDEKRMKKSLELWKQCFDKDHPTREVPKSFSVVVYKKAQSKS